MDTATLNSAKALKATIDNISAVQAIIATAGHQAVVIVSDSQDGMAVSEQDLKEALGSTAYNTIAAAALVSLNTALASAKTTAEASLTAL